MADLNEDQMEDIQERFDIFDKIGDKAVESDQVVDVLRALGMNPITADVKKMLKASDLEGKRVGLDTFCSMYQQFAAQPVIATVEDMVEALKTFDKNNSGNMGSAALRGMLMNLGDKLNEAEADVIMGKYEDENGLVCYGQMIKSLIAGN